MSADVEALALIGCGCRGHKIAHDPEVNYFCGWHQEEVQQVLDALPEMLRADGDAGDALRARLADFIASVKAEALREAADDETLTDCACGHGLWEHNGLGCYARISYEPLVECACTLDDNRHDGELVAINLRKRADKVTK